MKTLVIHPDDRSTDFLKQIYEDKDWTVINEHKNKLPKNKFIQAIKDHDRIVMMGHGYPYGLFMSHIDSSLVYLLREKECVCIWCNADQFVNRYKLTGFYTGMFISEVSEASWFHIKTNQNEIDFSNKLFTQLVTDHIDLDNPQPIIKENYVGDSAVIQFNNDRLYFRDEESILNDSDLDNELLIT